MYDIEALPLGKLYKQVLTEFFIEDKKFYGFYIDDNYVKIEIFVFEHSVNRYEKLYLNIQVINTITDDEFFIRKNLYTNTFIIKCITRRYSDSEFIINRVIKFDILHRLIREIRRIHRESNYFKRTYEILEINYFKGVYEQIDPLLKK